MALWSSLPPLFPYELHTAQRRRSWPWVASKTSSSHARFRFMRCSVLFSSTQAFIEQLVLCRYCAISPQQSWGCPQLDIQMLCYLDYAWTSCSSMSQLPSVTLGIVDLKAEKEVLSGLCSSAVLLSLMFVSEGVWETYQMHFSGPHKL